MKKKFLFSIIALSIISMFSVVHTFANTGIANTVEDKAQEAGNTIKDSAETTRNTVEGVETKVENTMNDAGQAVKSGTENLKNDVVAGNRGDNYNASRTSTDTTMGGMTTNTWIWIVVGIIALAALIYAWYYNRKRTTNNHHTND